MSAVSIRDRLRFAWTSGLVWAVVALGTWCALLGYIQFSGRIVSFLHPLFRPLVPGTAVVLGLMVLALLFLPRRDGEELDPCCPGCGGDRVPSPWRRAFGCFVLVVPAVVAAWVSPDSYSLQTVMNRGIIAESHIVRSLYRSQLATDLALPDAPMEGVALEGDEDMPGFLDFLTVDETGARELELLDLLFLAEDPRLRPVMEEIRISVRGQWIEPARSPKELPNGTLVRLVMICCAADARPVGVFVETGGLELFWEEMDWLKIRGRVTYPVVGGRRVAIIEADDIEHTTAPAEIFLF